MSSRRPFHLLIQGGPVSEVWQKLENFHDLPWALKVMPSIEKVGSVDDHHEIAAKRILNHAFHEILLDLDFQQHRLKYSINDGPSPVSKAEGSNYYSVVDLSPIDNGARIIHAEWTSSWDSNSDR